MAGDTQDREDEPPSAASPAASGDAPTSDAPISDTPASDIPASEVSASDAPTSVVPPGEDAGDAPTPPDEHGLGTDSPDLVPSPPRWWQRESVRLFVRHTAWTFAFLALFWFLDPMNLGTASDRASAEIFYRLVAPTYPKEPDPGIEAAVDDKTGIAVVLLNDEGLRRIGEQETSAPLTWPPPFWLHERIIRRILEAEPRALFIDFGFFDDRGDAGLDDFAETLRDCAWRPDAREAPDDGRCLWRTPVFMSAVETPRSCRAGGRPDGWSKTMPPELRREPVADDGGGPRVLQELAQAVTGLVSARSHPDHYALYNCRSQRPSAALALARTPSVSPEDTAWPPPDLGPLFDERPCRCPAPGAAEEIADLRLSVWWPTWGTETAERGIFACRTLRDGVLGRMWQQVEFWLSDLVTRAGRITRLAGADAPPAPGNPDLQSCPPHRTASVDQVLYGGDEIDSFLLDRYVLYGADFTMASDRIEPPTHEPLPGVYLHAVALDNLLRLGTGYIKAEPDVGSQDWMFLAVALLISVVSTVAWRHKCCLEGIWPFRGRVKAAEDSIAQVTWLFLCFAATVVLVLAAVSISFYLLNWAPVNFIGLLGLAGLQMGVRSWRVLVSETMQ